MSKIPELNQREFDEFIKNNRAAVLIFYVSDGLISKQVLDSAKKEVKDLPFKVVKVDMLKNLELRRRLGLIAAPSVVVFLDGKFVGLKDKNFKGSFREVLKECLPGLEF